MNHGAGHMTHTPVDLPAGAGAPTLAAELLKDAKAGWNLHIQTTNFRFSPEDVNRANTAGEGHAHVYVNGRKIARHYGPWLHIETLPEGAVVMIELNANDHSPLSVGGDLLRVELTAPNE